MEKTIPSNQNPKFIKVAIIGAIIIVGLIFFVLTDQSRQTAVINFFGSPSANSPTASGKPNKIEGWRSYKHSKYGFSFQYPEGFKLLDSAQVLTIQTASNNNIDFYMFTDDSATITDYLKKSDEKSQTGYEGKPSFEVHSTKEIVINGINAVQREEYVFAADLTRLITYFGNGNTVVAIALIPPPGNDLELDEPTYQQLLSTFYFTQ